MSFYKKKKASSTKKIIKSDPKKTSICLECTKAALDQSECQYCGGEIHQFDSLMEANRYIDLKQSPYISDITVQREFKYGIPIAQYSDGHIVGNREPIFIKYTTECTENSAYKVDFIYYDITSLRGWIAEEFKPCLSAFDNSARKNLVNAYDQHHQWGDFCVSYPELNLEGKNIKNYKRLFISKKNPHQKNPRYVDFNTFFKINI